MEKQSIKIVWTDPAKNDLQSIYNYLAEISITIAEKQIFRLIDSVELLEVGFFSIGQKESLLSNHPNGYRYLVKDNYKIIYHLSGQEVVIDMVFDTRQNPTKMVIER